MSRTRFDHMNCGVGRALEVLGDWWTLLIIRDAFLGLTRFAQFERSLGIAKNILTDRLAHLVDHGIFERADVGEAGQRYEYRLTAKGRSVLPVLTALREWSDDWVFGRGKEPLILTDRRTGKRIAKMRLRDAEGREIALGDLRAIPGPGATADTKRRLAGGNETRPRRPTSGSPPTTSTLTRAPRGARARGGGARGATTARDA